MPFAHLLPGHAQLLEIARKDVLEGYTQRQGWDVWCIRRQGRASQSTTYPRLDTVHRFIPIQTMSYQLTVRVQGSG
jgi:hypothetical protein